MKLFLFIALSGCQFELILGNLESDTIPLSAIKVIEKYGYPAESHLVETEDGYFMQLHRIPHGKNSSSTSSKKPLLMLHGMLCSSDTLLLMGPNSIPFLAADRGYDVWLANFRGNLYGKLHRTLSTKSSEFWNFSFHEIGFYDLPAQIDYICNYTQRDKITLMGLSLGSTVQLVMASTRPDYQKKVQAAVLVAAPSVFIDSKGVFQSLALAYPLSYSKPFINSELSGETPLRRIIMAILGFLGERGNSKNPNSLTDETGMQESTKLTWYLLRLHPPSVSKKLPMHYFQNAITGKFQQYDYGPAENLIKYNSREPPEYNLESITMPTSLIYAERDEVAGQKDEEYLLKRMKSIKGVLIIEKKLFHVGFMLCDNCKEIYDKMLNFMDNF